MQSRRVNGFTLRPLANGDTATVATLFDRLGPRSRERRFGGAKPSLSAVELELLSRVDGDHHVVVAYVDGDRAPAGIGRLARDGDAAEIAFEVADAYQGRGIGSTLADEIAGVARAAGYRELRATVQGDNPRVVSLLTRCAKSLSVSWNGGGREFVARLG